MRKGGTGQDAVWPEMKIRMRDDDEGLNYPPSSRPLKTRHDTRGFWPQYARRKCFLVWPETESNKVRAQQNRVELTRIAIAMSDQIPKIYELHLGRVSAVFYVCKQV